MRRRTKDIMVLAVLMLLVSFYAAGSGVYGAAAVSDDSGIAVKVQIGFGKFYKLGYPVPISIEVDNQLKDINGELQVEVPGDVNNATLYAVNVNLPKNSTKKFVLNVPMQSFATKIKVNLVEGKQTVFTASPRIEPGAGTDTMVIGILSDDFESVKYIDKVTLGMNQNISTKNVRLDENNFPSQADVLKMFNVIIINNFDTSRLGQDQYDALKKWVTDGGLLIIGTGPSYSKTLNIFKDDFLSGQTGAQSAITTDAISRLVSGRSDASGGSGQMRLDILDINMKDSTSILSEGSTVLVSKVSKGKGTIGVAAFDFGLEPISGWTGGNEFADRLINRLLPPFYSSIDFQKGILLQDNGYSVDSSLRNIPELPTPKMSYIFVIFGAYILAAAPISYLVLKKLDRRELMWVTIPVLSLVFSAVVYTAGFGTRLSEPVVNIISLVDMDDKGYGTVKTYAGVFTPAKNNIRVETRDNTSLRPMLVNNGYYGPGPGSQEDNPKQIQAKVILAPKTAIEFYKTGIWSMKTLSMEAAVEKTGGIQTDISFVDDHFVGTVKNNSGYDLSESYIVAANQYAAVGPVANGETKKIDLKAGSYFGNRYDLMNAIYKDPYSGSNPPARFNSSQIQQIRFNQQKRQILDYYFTGSGVGDSSVKLIGWSSNTKAPDILVNGKTTRRYEKQFIASNVYLNFKNGTTAEYPFGYIKPSIINNLTAGNYDDYGKTFYGRGNVEIDYTIDSSIKPETVRIKYGTGGKNVKQYIWNTSLKDWEEGNFSSFTIGSGDVEKYIDGKNMLRLKFELMDDNIQLPQISVKGSVR